MSETIQVRFRSKAELRRHVLDDVGAGGLLWVTDRVVKAGEVYAFDLRVAGRAAGFAVKGTVVWRRARPPGRSDLPEGVGIEFDDTDTAALGTLYAWLESSNEEQGLVATDERRFRRGNCDLKVEFLYARDIVTGRAVNISEEGLRIVAERALPVDTRLCFFLYPAEYKRPYAMEGRVVWNRRDTSPAVMGLELMFDQKRHRSVVRRFVNDLLGEVQTLPPEAGVAARE